MQYLEVAFVGELPAFVPRPVLKKNVIQGAIHKPVFDWSGAGAKLLGLTNPNALHLFVIDRQGCLRFKLVGPYSAEYGAQVEAQITRNL
ncbi:MAG: hypothetical protein BroJett015_24350 [Chloroflexota bacterium]|nr:MAG: hypothetical protein BroJett015_24350 [Chloroflexota bacterium]